MIEYDSIKVGDKVICNVIYNGGLRQVEHTVTKIGWDLFGVRHDIGKEVQILRASIVEYFPSLECDYCENRNESVAQIVFVQDREYDINLCNMCKEKWNGDTSSLTELMKRGK